MGVAVCWWSDDRGAGVSGKTNRRVGGKKMKEEWIYGYQPVLEALESGVVSEVCLSTGRRRGVEVLEKVTRREGVRLSRMREQALSALCGEGNHQGIAARTRGYAYIDFEEELESLVSKKAGEWRETGALVLALDGIQDPMNLGAILRTAAGAGVDLVLLPERKSAGVTAAAIKSSAGQALKVKVARVTNLVRSLEVLKKVGFWVLGASAAGGNALWDRDVRGRLVVVMGSEGKGMRRLVEESCDYLVTIPLTAGVESLNVSASTAMILYEVMRQERESV